MMIVCLFVFSEKPCALYCTPAGRDAPALMTERVLDGTPCGPYESDLCVHGRCQVLYFLDCVRLYTITSRYNVSCYCIYAVFGKQLL